MAEIGAAENNIKGSTETREFFSLETRETKKQSPYIDYIKNLNFTLLLQII